MSGNRFGEMALLLKSIFCPSGGPEFNSQHHHPQQSAFNSSSRGSKAIWPPEVAVHIMTKAGSSLFQESQSYKQQPKKKKKIKDSFFISPNIGFHVSQASLEFVVAKDDVEFLIFLPLPLKY